MRADWDPCYGILCADNGSEFAAMLNEMRLGKISDETVKSFQALSRPLTFNDGIETTEL